MKTETGSLLMQVEELKKQVEQIKDEHDAALRAGAEMRHLLVESPKPWPGAQSLGWYRAREHALSTDCGKGYRSPEEYAELEAECEQMRRGLVAVSNLIEEWAIHQYDDSCTSSELSARLYEVVSTLKKELARLESLTKGSR